MDGDALISIGRMARRSGLTVKALRHYDRIGLLVPATVDPETGYRYYRSEQVTSARLIQILRAVDVHLEQVRACLAAPHRVLRRSRREHRRGPRQGAESGSRHLDGRHRECADRARYLAYCTPTLAFCASST